MVSGIMLTAGPGEAQYQCTSLPTIALDGACLDKNVAKIAEARLELINRAGFRACVVNHALHSKSGKTQEERANQQHWAFGVKDAPGLWLACDDSGTSLSIEKIKKHGKRTAFELTVLAADAVASMSAAASGSGAAPASLATRRADNDHEAAADAIGVLLKQWRDSGVLLMDEVDMLLHPLKSELNFPIGAKMKIDVDGGGEGSAERELTSGGDAIPEGLRWELPMALIDVVLSASVTAKGAAKGGGSSSFASPSSSGKEARIVDALLTGRKAMALQMTPHLLLLSSTGPTVTKLRAEVARVATEFIQSRQLIRWKRGYSHGAVSPEDMLEYVLQTDGTDWRLKTEFDQALAPATMQLLNLSRQWISTFFCHSFSKINRVNYGLLQGAQLAKEAGDFFNPDPVSAGGAAMKKKKTKKPPASPISRLLLALPFVGLEQPADSSEFAHPDVGKKSPLEKDVSPLIIRIDRFALQSRSHLPHSPPPSSPNLQRLVLRSVRIVMRACANQICAFSLRTSKHHF